MKKRVRFTIQKQCHICHRPCEESEFPTEKYPLSGFWKHSSFDHFGYDISSAGDGLYIVLFKGPGGDPGRYDEDVELHKTPIYGDKRFEVIDINNMMIKGFFAYRKVQRYKNRCSQELEIFTP